MKVEVFGCPLPQETEKSNESVLDIHTVFDLLGCKDRMVDISGIFQDRSTFDSAVKETMRTVDAAVRAAADGECNEALRLKAKKMAADQFDELERTIISVTA